MLFGYFGSLFQNCFVIGSIDNLILIFSENKNLLSQYNPSQYNINWS